MGDVIKVLGQVNPTINILTVLYTVPSMVQTTVSSIVICNTSGNIDSFSVSVAVGGAADTLKQYIYYGQPLDANDTFVATIGMSLAAGDVVRVLSSAGNLSFNLFGVENS